MKEKTSSSLNFDGSCEQADTIRVRVDGVLSRSEANQGSSAPLGIPTVRDRVVQSAVKQIVEPIFEAGFWHVSYGFRPGRGCHGALEHIRMTIRPRAVARDGKRRTVPYAWLIEGDIKSCFDRIGHHRLMERVRMRLVDRKVTRLLNAFLKAGALSETQFTRTDAGTPQGGIISPLLANIALSAIEERYGRWVNLQTKRRPNRKADGIRAAWSARTTDRHAGRPVFFPIRYADDFVVLVAGTREQADAEKEALAGLLRECLGLELSPAKTRTTATTDGFNFLGHRVRLRWDLRFGYTPRIEIPKEKRLEFRHRIKELTGRDRTYLSLTRMLHELNHILRGWGHFYRFCTNAKRFLNQLDWYVRDRIWRWLRKKYPKAPCGRLTRFRRPITGGRQVVWAGSSRLVADQAKARHMPGSAQVALLGASPRVARPGKEHTVLLRDSIREDLREIGRATIPVSHLCDPYAVLAAHSGRERECSSILHMQPNHALLLARPPGLRLDSRHKPNSESKRSLPTIIVSARKTFRLAVALSVLRSLTARFHAQCL